MSTKCEYIIAHKAVSADPQKSAAHPPEAYDSEGIII